MGSTIIVGVLYAALLVWAASHSIKDMKSSKCAGCTSATCSLRHK